MHISPLAQQPQLFDAVTQMLHREWSDLPNWRDASVIQQRLQARNAEQAKTVTLVATTTAGELMATASIIHYELGDLSEREFWLGEVITASEHRGKGLASALVTQLIAEARLRGITALWLYTPDQQALYRRFGWQDVEQREIANEDVTVMVLNIVKGETDAST
ncbi:GCN5 family acetyltransferase [Pantoea sp. RIT-PI-b]|uniref:GNAT family N-acetyltransferase n=1 Tax=Pantoea sp. RIT-PI-b TaxID=1681195 RepID=UPI0006765E51|nr:GNAT family N-acetyltransferase [Pantoea sp. RIT-PI-b]KNC05906.1 GCN5 family acetyltransferase [Pantoea sp. RIT-PI-b]